MPRQPNACDDQSVILSDHLKTDPILPCGEWLTHLHLLAFDELRMAAWRAGSPTAPSCRCSPSLRTTSILCLGHVLAYRELVDDQCLRAHDSADVVGSDEMRVALLLSTLPYVVVLSVAEVRDLKEHTFR